MQLVMPAIGFGLVEAAVLACAALGFNLEIAVSDMVNVGYVSFMLAGQFLALVMQRIGVDLWVAMAVGALGAGLLAAVTERFVLTPFKRAGAPHWAIVMVSFSLFLILDNVLELIFGAGTFVLNAPESLTRPIHIAGMVLTGLQLISLAVAAALVGAADLLLRFSAFGRQVRAVADDESLAMASGIESARVTVLTWFLSGILGGASGALLAIAEANFSVSAVTVYLILVLAAAFCGGAGKPYGAALGALLIGWTMELVAIWIQPQYAPMIAFSLFIVTLIVRPGGLLGMGKGSYRA